jgi:hypothetical protein
MACTAPEPPTWTGYTNAADAPTNDSSDPAAGGNSGSDNPPPVRRRLQGAGGSAGSSTADENTTNDTSAENSTAYDPTAPFTDERVPMRHACCARDPTAADCVPAGVDCSQSSFGSCVEMPDCSEHGPEGRYFFNEFMGRCELKEHCPAYHEWD